MNQNTIVNLVHTLDATTGMMSQEEWLESHSEGWTNAERLICQAAESGADRDRDFDEEQYQEDAYINEYLSRVIERREAATTMRHS